MILQKLLSVVDIPVFGVIIQNNRATRVSRKRTVAPFLLPLILNCGSMEGKKADVVKNKGGVVLWNFQQLTQYGYF